MAQGKVIKDNGEVSGYKPSQECQESFWGEVTFMWRPEGKEGATWGQSISARRKRKTKFPGIKRAWNDIIEMA